MHYLCKLARRAELPDNFIVIFILGIFPPRKMYPINRAENVCSLRESTNGFGQRNRRGCIRQSELRFHTATKQLRHFAFAVNSSDFECFFIELRDPLCKTEFSKSRTLITFTRERFGPNFLSHKLACTFQTTGTIIFLTVKFTNSQATKGASIFHGCVTTRVTGCRPFSFTLNSTRSAWNARMVFEKWCFLLFSFMFSSVG